MKRLLMVSPLVALLVSGCMTGNAKRFFAENKSYKFIKPVITLATPWGTEVISAEEISSQVVYPLNLDTSKSNIVTTIETKNNNSTTTK